jgi:hypothetical protein
LLEKLSIRADSVPYPDWQDSLDEKADPCENFFKFACGQYEQKHKILFEMLFKLDVAIEAAKPYLDECLTGGFFDFGVWI